MIIYNVVVYGPQELGGTTLQVGLGDALAIYGSLLVNVPRNSSNFSHQMELSILALCIAAFCAPVPKITKAQKLGLGVAASAVH
jgi:hypothetical protein